MAIAGVFQKTFDNRAEGYDELSGVSVVLLTQYDRKSNSPAWKTWKGDPVLLLDKSVQIEVAVKANKKKGVLRPAHTAEMEFFGASLFAKTSKMGAGSFSLPAGPVSPSPIGGTCPCSALPDSYSVWKKIPGVKADPPGGRREEQICRKCYSNKGNYMHRSSQYAQVIRLNWLNAMLSQEGVDRTAEAFKESIETHAGNVKRRAACKEDPRFFRIHDSGDLYSIQYWKMWKAVCSLLPDILFWMPTRAWWNPAMAMSFGTVPANLAFRPSAYHFDDHAPVVPGMSAGTTAHFWEKDRKTDPVAKGLADWPCPAYAGGKSGGKCIGAIERAKHEWTDEHPLWLEQLKRMVRSLDREQLDLTDGGRDCRVCWINRELSVSYKAH
jgi:hypothetical protein